MSIEINGQIYRELRCGKCRKLICLEYVFSGRIAFHCPRCGDFNVFKFKSMGTERVDGVEYNEEIKLKSNQINNKPKRGGEI